MCVQMTNADYTQYIFGIKIVCGVSMMKIKESSGEF